MTPTQAHIENALNSLEAELYRLDAQEHELASEETVVDKAQAQVNARYEEIRIGQAVIKKQRHLLCAKKSRLLAERIEADVAAARQPKSPAE